MEKIIKSVNVCAKIGSRICKSSVYTFALTDQSLFMCLFKTFLRYIAKDDI